MSQWCNTIHYMQWHNHCRNCETLLERIFGRGKLTRPARC